MFYDQCLIVLADLKDAEAVTEKMNAAPQGHLRISAPVGFGSCLLAPALMQFMEIYNKIDIELVISATSTGNATSSAG